MEWYPTPLAWNPISGWPARPDTAHRVLWLGPRGVDAPTGAVDGDIWEERLFPGESITSGRPRVGRFLPHPKTEHWVITLGKWYFYLGIVMVAIGIVGTVIGRPIFLIITVIGVIFMVATWPAFEKQSTPASG